MRENATGRHHHRREPGERPRIKFTGTNGVTPTLPSILRVVNGFHETVKLREQENVISSRWLFPFEICAINFRTFRFEASRFGVYIDPVQFR
ncbi:hypothetical protein GWI33_005963 [Rhynchophorus ferrugineus]|uniref:Uncharacterized protein n=1 Tax=Rhynchophorus ferrugineus TaxID=354439 RepID=A0A834MLZ8_RHYFE|nr:hypothetical protein GWI33_005963 [Rhynchophorus ferrugineus]